MGGGNGQTSPLVLDLTGTGLNLTALSYVSPYFDLTGSGFATKTGWIGTGTGLLCLDRNGNGQINSGLELFGTAGGYADGFAALRALDSNNDGVIDARDAAFTQLRVWVNPEQDGVVHPGELLTLIQLGITSISLTATASAQVINGNAVNLTGTYTLSNGTQRTIGDAWFTTSPTYTRPDATPDLPAAVAALPELQGYGTMTDLRSAMTTDSALKTRVQSVVADAAKPSALLADVPALMLQWAGAAGIDPASRGGVFDAQQLAFLERYTGIAFNDPNYGTDPRWESAINLREGWTSAEDGILARLLAQTGGLPAEFTYNTAADFVLPAHSLAASIASLYARFGEPTAANAAQWEVALRVADAFRLDAHLDTPSYLATIAANSSGSLASIASALAYGMGFTVATDGTLSLTGVTAQATLYAGPAVRLIDLAAPLGYPMPLNDTIVYTRGSGALELSVFDGGDSPDNVLQLGAGISEAQVTIHADASDHLLITDGTPGDLIQIDGGFNTAFSGIDALRFADGTVWTRQQLLQIETQGSPGADTMYGTSGADTFDGKGAPAGFSDYAEGDGGGDTFIFNPGYGVLEINEIDLSDDPANSLAFGAGIDPSRVRVTSDGSNLYLTDGDQVQIDGTMLHGFSGVQSVRFANGVVWTGQQLLQMETQGTQGADTLYGTSGAETFDGKGAPAGSEDYVQGGGGNDIFVFNKGYGQLEINEMDFAASPHNTLKFGAGITLGQVTVTKDSANNIYLTDGTAGDRIKLDRERGGSSYGVQSVQFANGSSWSKAQLVALAH